MLNKHCYYRLLVSVVLCIVSVISLSSCEGVNPNGNPSIADGNSYAELFKKYYKKANSPLVKGILADGVITEAEMYEFADVFRKCMADKNMEWSWSEEEGESVLIRSEHKMTNEETSKLTWQCYDETDYMYIVPLHDFIKNNPDNLNATDFNKKVLECMKSHDLIDKNMDPDYFLTFYATPQGMDSPEYQHYLMPLEDENNPNFDPDKAKQYLQCVQNPLELG